MKKISLLLLILIFLTACHSNSNADLVNNVEDYQVNQVISLGEANFSSEEITNKSFENYAPLDSLGRVGTAFACLGLDTLPTKERGDISDIYPSGWEQNEYDFIDGGVLYNRSHLIAYSLSAENDNELNLMTGTRSFNTEAMQYLEKKVRDYINRTGNHVMYRVTPDFKGDNLVANGVKMEAYSVEDNGAGINESVYCYNIEPGVVIDYKTGNNWKDKEEKRGPTTYILNTNTKKIHRPDCDSVKSMSEKNKQETTEEIEILISQGYTSCNNCHPT